MNQCQRYVRIDRGVARMGIARSQPGTTRNRLVPSHQPKGFAMAFEGVGR